MQITFEYCTAVPEPLHFIIRGGHVDLHRLLNYNSLSGEVPSALGALPVRGAMLKYVFVHFVPLHSCYLCHAES